MNKIYFIMIINFAEILPEQQNKILRLHKIRLVFLQLYLTQLIYEICSVL